MKHPKTCPPSPDISAKSMARGAAQAPKRRQGGRPTLHEAQELTNRIIEVATDHFLRLGYNETTFDRIAREVGTSKGALYVRYPEKVALFSAICEQLISSHYRSDIVLTADDRPIRKSLSIQGASLIAAALHPTAVALYNMITREAPRHPELLRSTLSVWEYYVTQMERYFLVRMERGLLRLREPRRAAEHFTQMVFGPVHVMLVHGRELPDEAGIAQHVEDVVLIFLGGIGRLELE